MITQEITDKVTKLILYTPHDTDFYCIKSDGTKYILQQRQSGKKNNKNFLSQVSRGARTKSPQARLEKLEKRNKDVVDRDLPCYYCTILMND